MLWVVVGGVSIFVLSFTVGAWFGAFWARRGDESPATPGDGPYRTPQRPSCSEETVPQPAPVEDPFVVDVAPFESLTKALHELHRVARPCPGCMRFIDAASDPMCHSCLAAQRRRDGHG